MKKNSSKKKVYEYVDLTDDVPIQKLSILDQLRVILQRLTFDESSEMKQEDVLTKGEMELKKDLETFILEAIIPLREGKKRNVIFTIASEFQPVLESVITQKRFADYYRIVIEKPKPDYDNIHFFYKIKFSVKEEINSKKIIKKATAILLILCALQPFSSVYAEIANDYDKNGNITIYSEEELISTKKDDYKKQNNNENEEIISDIEQDLEDAEKARTSLSNVHISFDGAGYVSPWPLYIELTSDDINNKITNIETATRIEGTIITSINNAIEECRYKPKAAEVSFLSNLFKTYGFLQKPFALVDMSTFDSEPVSLFGNTGINQTDKKLVMDPNYTGEYIISPLEVIGNYTSTDIYSEKNTRAYELLGRDIDVVEENFAQESLMYDSNGKLTLSNDESVKVRQKSTYTINVMENTLIKSDVITALYKALDDSQYNIQVFYVPTEYDVPVQYSPLLSQAPMKDSVIKKGRYYSEVFITRTVPEKYWNSAFDDGIVDIQWEDDEFVKLERNENITIANFCVMLADYLALKGEAVITKEEEQMLLLGYGSKLPYELSNRQLTAIKYLLVRGIIEDNLDWSSNLTKDILLNMLVRAKYEDQRLTFKKVEIPYIKEALDAGYYPSSVSTIDTAMTDITMNIEYKTDRYDYVIPLEENKTKFVDKNGRFITDIKVSSNKISTELFGDTKFMNNWMPMLSNVEKKNRISTLEANGLIYNEDYFSFSLPSGLDDVGVYSFQDKKYFRAFSLTNANSHNQYYVEEGGGIYQRSKDKSACNLYWFDTDKQNLICKSGKKYSNTVISQWRKAVFYNKDGKKQTIYVVKKEDVDNKKISEDYEVDTDEEVNDLDSTTVWEDDESDTEPIEKDINESVEQKEEKNKQKQEYQDCIVLDGKVIERNEFDDYYIGKGNYPVYERIPFDTSVVSSNELMFYVDKERASILGEIAIEEVSNMSKNSPITKMSHVSASSILGESKINYLAKSNTKTPSNTKTSELEIEFKCSDITKLKWDGKELKDGFQGSNATCKLKDSGKGIYTLTISGDDPYGSYMSLLTTTGSAESNTTNFPVYVKDNKNVMVSTKWLQKKKLITSVQKMDDNKFLLFGQSQQIIIDKEKHRIITGSVICDVEESDPLIIYDSANDNAYIDYRAVIGIAQQWMLFKTTTGNISITVNDKIDSNKKYSTITPLLGESYSTQVMIDAPATKIEEKNEVYMNLEDTYSLSNYIIYKQRKSGAEGDYLIIFKPRVSKKDVVSERKLQSLLYITLPEQYTCSVYKLTADGIDDAMPKDKISPSKIIKRGEITNSNKKNLYDGYWYQLPVCGVDKFDYKAYMKGTTKNTGYILPYYALTAAKNLSKTNIKKDIEKGGTFCNYYILDCNLNLLNNSGKVQTKIPGELMNKKTLLLFQEAVALKLEDSGKKLSAINSWYSTHKNGEPIASSNGDKWFLNSGQGSFYDINLDAKKGKILEVKDGGIYQRKNNVKDSDISITPAIIMPSSFLYDLGTSSLENLEQRQSIVAIFYGSTMVQVDTEGLTDLTDNSEGDKKISFCGHSFNVTLNTTEEKREQQFKQIINTKKDVIWIYNIFANLEIGTFTSIKHGITDVEDMTSGARNNIFDWENWMLIHNLEDINDIMTIVIIFLLEIVPRIMFFFLLATATLGLVRNNKIVQKFCSNIVDIYKITSFGLVSIETINKGKIWVSITLAMAFLLMMNNFSLVRLIAWFFEQILLFLSN